MEQNNNTLGSVVNIFNKLSIQQRLMIGGIFVVTVVLLIFVLFIFNEPNYSPLYTNLASDDASKVVESLTAKKIPYKLEDNGETILVPGEKIYELRLQMAGQGIPNSGIIGYEIFDKNTMGMSEFMQKLNFKRALEGEISRTIIQQNGIEGARVHIVFPEKSIFKNEQKEPTASVVLKLTSNSSINKNNITAISNLVAGSVEGLRPEKVTILNTQGKLLSQQVEDNSMQALSGKQYEVKSKIESYLADKAQSLLDNVLGYGNSMVRVNVDLDSKQVEKTMEMYDPESQVAVSEQTIKSESTGSSISDSNAVISENSTTNYEISKTIERVIEGAGNLKRITVAAVINGIPTEVTEGEETKIINKPRSEEQLQKLEQIVRQSVGIDDTRPDQVSIVSIPFETQEFEEIGSEEVSPLNNIERYSNYLMIFLALGAALFVLKGLLKKLKTEKIMIGTMNNGYSDEAFNDLLGAKESGQSENQLNAAMQQKPKRKAAIAMGDIEDEITDDAAMQKAKQDKIVNYVAKNPAEAAKLINSWLRENEYR